MNRVVARARSLLARRDAWIEGRQGDYRLRLDADRRLRPALRFDEAVFLALIAAPGLRRREGGGWTARMGAVADGASPAPGRPGFLEGERAVMSPDGRMTMRRANLGESPLVWLARRRDASGRPWLSPAQLAAGERLRRDAELALSGPSLTMRWDALPRGGGGSSARPEPNDRALAAGGRAAAALAACVPELRSVLEAVCVRGDALGIVERDLALGRGRARLLLSRGLSALADYYGV